MASARYQHKIDTLNHMEKFTCILIDENNQDRERLTTLLKENNLIEIIGSNHHAKEGLDLVNELEPNFLFFAVKNDDSNAFKLLEKIRKQPTIVFLTDNQDAVKSFETNKLHYLRKPFKPSDVQQLLLAFQKTHHQIASKMQGILAKLKLED